MTLDQLIGHLQVWRDLKKIGDAPCIINVNGTPYFVDLVNVSFGASGHVYLWGDTAPEPSDDQIDEVIDAVILNTDMQNLDRDEAHKNVRKILPR
jgi:hypothetical protein